LKKLYIISVIAVFFCCLTEVVQAQIVQFSQYYSSPAILGPSFVGINNGTRVILNYRNQWPGVPSKFVTYAFEFDHYMTKRNSGIGLAVLRDQAGSGNLNVTQVAAQYAYDRPLFGYGTKKVHFRPGVSFKYSQRGLDFYKLVFNDQLSFNGIAETSIENIPDLHGYADATGSMLFYSSTWWAGFTADNLFTPDQSLRNYGTAASELPMLFSVYGGYVFDLRKRGQYRTSGESITVTMLYKMQAGYTQMDMGLYWSKNPFILGAWYRGLPFLNKPEIGYYTTDAVILLFGFKLYNLSFGYSYDITVSQLMSQAAGAHEISLRYDFRIQGGNNLRRPRGAVSCPIY